MRDRNRIWRTALRLSPWSIAGIAALLFISAATVRAGKPQSLSDLPQTGKALYEKACAACHGVDGTGVSSSQAGFDTPLPDFTDCNFATREPDVDWIYVTEKGGPARAFVPMMPAFGSALTRAQIQKTLNHIRTFCGDGAWPRGELNLPRPIFTTKAYPEDELVLSTIVNTSGPDKIEMELIYEQRFGTRNQFEVVFPFGWSEQPVRENDGDTEWRSSVGDIGLGLKRVMFHSLEHGAIITLGGEIFFPTGDEDEGFGNDTTVVEPYLSYGQLLPYDFFLHSQAGLAYPFDDDKVNEEAFLRFALGRTFLLGPYGRLWAPMVELLGSRELVSGADENWDLAPQFQFALSTRQHVRINLGARIPLNDTDQRDTRFGAYLLWEWFDGSFFEGW